MFGTKAVKLESGYTPKLYVDTYNAVDEYGNTVHTYFNIHETDSSRKVVTVTNEKGNIKELHIMSGEYDYIIACEIDVIVKDNAVSKEGVNIQLNSNANIEDTCDVIKEVCVGKEVSNVTIKLSREDAELYASDLTNSTITMMHGGICEVDSRNTIMYNGDLILKCENFNTIDASYGVQNNLDIVCNCNNEIRNANIRDSRAYYNTIVDGGTIVDSIFGLYSVIKDAVLIESTSFKSHSNITAKKAKYVTIEHSSTFYCVDYHVDGKFISGSENYIEIAVDCTHKSYNPELEISIDNRNILFIGATGVSREDADYTRFIKIECESCNTMHLEIPVKHIRLKGRFSINNAVFYNGDDEPMVYAPLEHPSKGVTLIKMVN